LLHHVRGSCAAISFQSSVGGVCESKTLGIKERCLPSVPNIELKVVESLNRAKIAHLDFSFEEACPIAQLVAESLEDN